MLKVGILQVELSCQQSQNAERYTIQKFIICLFMMEDPLDSGVNDLMAGLEPKLIGLLIVRTRLNLACPGSGAATALASTPPGKGGLVCATRPTGPQRVA